MLVYALMPETNAFALLMKTLVPTLIAGIFLFGVDDEIKWRLGFYNKVEGDDPSLVKLREEHDNDNKFETAK